MTTRKVNETRPLRPSWLRRRLAKWPLMARRFGLGTLIAKRVMFLTTKGRVTGGARRTPLWYVREGDNIYCLSGWGSSSDWLKNLKANPNVLVQIGKERWETQGALIQELPEREKVLEMFLEKYGRRTVHLFYHMDRLVLVAFPLTHQGTTDSCRKV